MSVVRKLKNTGHAVLALTASHYYGNPAKDMNLIGVTGTDGKTTTSNLIYHILNTSGEKAAVISTLGAIIDGKNYETGFHVTTPSPFAIQKYLKLAKEKGCEYVVLEVTSHALDQNRVLGLHFAIGVLTNITHEHFDYHKTYAKYVESKLKLLKNSDISVVNSNGEWLSYVSSTIPANKLVTYSLNNKNDHFTLDTLPFKIKTRLLGDFNMENILAAALACLKLGISPDKISSAVESFDPPKGRQEIIKKPQKPIIMIDFAHTPNSFKSVLPVIKEKTKGKLIHVFGAAGERDSLKRPEMGSVAARFDDIIILTAEDPRRESIKEINSQIKKGLFGKKVIEIEDREKAIKYALSIAREEDAIIITGKGHEKSMNLGHGEVEWNDSDVVLKLLKDL